MGSANTTFAQATSEDPTQSGEEVVSPRIVNGVYTSDYPSTGLLLHGSSAGSADAICTGTLIGCRTVLTAEHCVDASVAASSIHVFFQHAGVFGVSSIRRHPTADLAVLRLSSEVTGIAPSPINEASNPAFGTQGEIVGFGRTYSESYNSGLKRMGRVVTESCAGHPTPGVNDTTHVCWAFEAPIGDPGDDSNTCYGDSGGPLFVNGSGHEKVVGSQDVVAGVTESGSNNTCWVADWSYDTSVFQHRQWIAQQGGTDLDRSFCGNIAQVGELGKSWYTGFSGYLSSGKTQARFTVDSLSVDKVLRVALNADKDADFDLYVKFGSAPTRASYDCRQYGANSFGVCEIQNPQEGTWHILADRYTGSGNFQVTATGLGESEHTQIANPMYAGYRVDWCKNWASDCGGPAAEAYCDAKYGTSSIASAWKKAVNIGASAPTRTIGDGRICDQAYCDGFESITCTQPCGSGYASALLIVPAVVVRKRLRNRRKQSE
jgi:hypothetical protein